MNRFESLFTPDYTHISGLVKHLNTEELKDILNNDERVDEIINDLKQVKDIEAEREMLLASTKSISEYNLAKQPDFEVMQIEIQSSHKRALELKDKLIEGKKIVESKNQSQSNETLLALLQAATSEIEEEADATVDAFLRNDLSVEDFLEKYMEVRKLAHLRRIKSEKLIGIIQGHTAPNTPTRLQKLRKAPAPPANPQVSPVQNPQVPQYNQNIPPVPARQAPYPPRQIFPAVPPFIYQPQPNPSLNYPYPSNSTYSIYSPYPQPPKYK